MDKIKLGIIGIGNMGSGHTNNILGGRCPEVELVAVADVNPDRLNWMKESSMTESFGIWICTKIAQWKMR